MENLGVYWNKDKDKYRDFVQTIVHLEHRFFYLNEVSLDHYKVYSRVGKLKKPKDPYKRVAPKELAEW